MRASVWMSQHVMQNGQPADTPIQLTDIRSETYGLRGEDQDNITTLIPWTSIRYVDLTD